MTSLTYSYYEPNLEPPELPTLPNGAHTQDLIVVDLVFSETATLDQIRAFCRDLKIKQICKDVGEQEPDLATVLDNGNRWYDFHLPFEAAWDEHCQCFDIDFAVPLAELAAYGIVVDAAAWQAKANETLDEKEPDEFYELSCCED